MLIASTVGVLTLNMLTDGNPFTHSPMRDAYYQAYLLLAIGFVGVFLFTPSLILTLTAYGIFRGMCQKRIEKEVN